MGPRPFRRGNEIAEVLENIDLQLQWGHVLSDVETPG